eukprot:SAG31_NODE_662_length_13028_cov_3.364529_8_plen_126_part_00
MLIGVRPCLQQKLGGLRVSVLGADEQRCATIVRGLIDVRPCLQQKLGGLRVSFLGADEQRCAAIVLHVPPQQSDFAKSKKNQTVNTTQELRVHQLSNGASAGLTKEDPDPVSVLIYAKSVPSTRL